MPVAVAGTPLPRTRSTLPLGVPAGSRTVTWPSSVGTFTSAPSAASANVTGTRTVRSLPLRPNNGCGAHVHDDVEVAGRAAVRARAAAALHRMRWPSATPAGMRTFTSRGAHLDPAARDTSGTASG